MPNSNRQPLTARAAEYRYGKDFRSSTCSQLCTNCGKANYFLGQLFDEAVPNEFHCVTCGHVQKRLYSE